MNPGSTKETFVPALEEGLVRKASRKTGLQSGVCKLTSGWLTEEERCREWPVRGHGVGRGTGAGSILEHVGWAHSLCVPRTVGGRTLKVGPALTSPGNPGSCLTVLKGPIAKLRDPNSWSTLYHKLAV